MHGPKKLYKGLTRLGSTGEQAGPAAVCGPQAGPAAVCGPQAGPAAVCGPHASCAPPS